MTNVTDANGRKNAVNTKPYTVLGAGQLAASVWKTSNTRDRFAYRFNIFRMCAKRGHVTQRFTPADLPDLARLAQLLAFEIAEDGCLDSDLRDDLSCLAACLDDVLPGGRSIPGRCRLGRSVADALRIVVDYLTNDEGCQFRDDLASGHIDRSVVLLACWLDGHLTGGEGLRELSDLEPLDEMGACPICAGNDGYVDIDRSRWFVCHQHYLRWYSVPRGCSGWGPPSTEDWRADAELVKTYRVIEPLRPALPQDEESTS